MPIQLLVSTHFDGYLIYNSLFVFSTIYCFVFCTSGADGFGILFAMNRCAKAATAFLLGETLALQAATHEFVSTVRWAVDCRCRSGLTGSYLRHARRRRSHGTMSSPGGATTPPGHSGRRGTLLNVPCSSILNGLGRTTGGAIRTTALQTARRWKGQRPQLRLRDAGRKPGLRTADRQLGEAVCRVAAGRNRRPKGVQDRRKPARAQAHALDPQHLPAEKAVAF